MDDLVNTLWAIEEYIRGSGIALTTDGKRLHVGGVAKPTAFDVVRLYRPSTADIELEASPKTILILTLPSQKAAESAGKHNHIVVPEGGFRIVAPSFAVFRSQAIRPPKSKRVKLMGRTGLVAETLLVGGERLWSVRELASFSKVSPSLAHRVLKRLETEGLLHSEGSGPEKLRKLLNSRALAETWSEEEASPTIVLRGYLYGGSDDAIVKKILEAVPGAALGGAMAANSFEPVLTRLPPPLRVWVPQGANLGPLKDAGFTETDEGVNVEIVSAKEDPWRVHVTGEHFPAVSPWRAWLEVSHASGRTEELAKALIENLVGGKTWK